MKVAGGLWRIEAAILVVPSCLVRLVLLPLSSTPHPPTFIRDISDQASRTETVRSPHRRGHPHSALRLGGQSEHSPALSGPRWSLSDDRGIPVFQEARAPSIEALQALLAKIIARLMRLLTRQGVLIEERGVRYLAGLEADRALTPLQAASCTYRIATGPRGAESVESANHRRSRRISTPTLCANAHGFSRSMLRCVAALISATNSNSCAATSPARQLPTAGSVAIAPVMSYCA